jgi:hypothetical protein
MTLAETIYQKSLSLSPEKAQEVLDFIDFIKGRRTETTSRPATLTAEPASLLSVFEQSGLVGCLDTDEQLSTTYKAKLDYSHKHGRTT